MQLLFFWFSGTYPETIKEQGGNLSPAYDFIVEKKFDGKYSLSNNKKWLRRKSVFASETGCIENISAIVGNNGAGKTTILRTLIDMEKWSSMSLEYQKKNVLGKLKRYVLVFEDGEQLLIYSNIIGLDCSKISLSGMSISLYTTDESEDMPFESHTLIFLANSYYIFNVSDTSFDEKGIRAF